jgi:hypothetical protein
MQPALILDKSFLDAASATSVQELCTKFRVMCSETLFFELLTTRRESQIRCFSKFPTEPGMIALLPDLSPLLRAEMEAGVSCREIGEYAISGTYVFNEKLASGTYEPSAEVLGTLSQWRKTVEAESLAFLERCQSVHQFFPELIGIEFRDFPAAVAAARYKVATDHEFTRSVFAAFDRIDLPAYAPDPKVITASWAWFRWVQCQLMAALRIFERYQCNVPTDPSAKVLTRAEHSMHDTQYVMLASLAGAIATNDAEIIEDVGLVAPNVKIVTTTAI